VSKSEMLRVFRRLFVPSSEFRFIRFLVAMINIFSGVLSRYSAISFVCR